MLLTYNNLCDTAGMTGMQEECSGEAHSLTERASQAVKLAEWASNYHSLTGREGQAWVSDTPVYVII